MIAPYCTPDPATGNLCDIYIGVNAFESTSYTIVASVNDGFQSRITLLDGQPQTGI